MNSMNTKKKGDLGEKLAREYLQSREYLILENNYQIRGAEIDIIAYKEDTLVFIEVKTRTNANYGTAAEAVTQKKCERIRLAALHYLAQQDYSENSTAVRFDVIEVYLLPSEAKIRHMQNAF